MSDPTGPEVIYAIRRKDGEDMGDYRFCTTNLGDWSAAEDDSQDALEATEYEMVKMVVEVVEVRMLPACSDCEEAATHWGLCEAHAREDDPSFFEVPGPAKAESTVIGLAMPCPTCGAKDHEIMRFFGMTALICPLVGPEPTIYSERARP